MIRFVQVRKEVKKTRSSLPVHRAADSSAPSIAIDFINAAELMKRQIDPEMVRELIRAGALDKLALDLPWPAFEQMLKNGITPALIQSLKRSADSAAAQTSATLKKALGYEPVLTFDSRNPRLKSWITENTGELIKSVTRDGKKAIKNVVSRALSEDMDFLDIFQTVKNSIGLTQQQANASLNLYKGLLDDGFDKEEALERADRYADKALKYRANLIATHETMVAANQGLNEGWSQAADQGLFNPKQAEVEWVVTDDDRLCPTCEAMDGVRRPFDGTWTVTLFDDKGNSYGTKQVSNVSESHPRCRCTSLLIL